MFSKKVLLFSFLLSLFVNQFLVDIDILVCYLLRYLICFYFSNELGFNVFHEERWSGLIVRVTVIRCRPLNYDMSLVNRRCDNKTAIIFKFSAYHRQRRWIANVVYLSITYKLLLHRYRIFSHQSSILFISWADTELLTSLIVIKVLLDLVSLLLKPLGRRFECWHVMLTFCCWLRGVIIVVMILSFLPWASSASSCRGSPRKLILIILIRFLI